MSTINTTASTGSAWPTGAAARAGQMKDRMFAKVDADGSGGVDKTELQGLIDHISEKTGASLGSADELYTKLDKNGDGSIGKDELADGMKSLMPAPSSTVEFAQRAGGHGDGPPIGMPPGPPPDTTDAGSATAGASGSDFDPLDTNQDGVVSTQEKAAGVVKDMVAELMKKLGSDGSDANAQHADLSSFAAALADRLVSEYRSISASSNAQAAGSGVDTSA